MDTFIYKISIFQIFQKKFSSTVLLLTSLAASVVALAMAANVKAKQAFGKMASYADHLVRWTPAEFDKYL